MNQYEQYKSSGVEWLGEVPSEWELKKVKNLFRLVTEPAPNNNDHKLLSVYSDIGVKPRAELEERGNRASTTDGYWMVKKGDIVVNKLLAWMGAVGLSEYDGVTSPAYDILRPIVPLSGFYYHLLFRMPLALSEFKRSSRGIMDMRLRLYFEELGNIKVPFPPLPTQQKIAAYLDDKTAKIDQAVEIYEKQTALLKEHKQIMIQEAVCGRLPISPNPSLQKRGTGASENNAQSQNLHRTAPLLDKAGLGDILKPSGIEWIGDIPEHWEVKKLKFLTAINTDVLPENTPSNLPIKYVDIGSVSFSNGIERIENFTFLTAPSRARRLAKKGDTIISTVRTYLKAISLIDENFADCVFSTGFAVLSPNQEIITPKFLSLFVKSDAFTTQVTLGSKGMSYPAINSTDLSNLWVALPPLSEQHQIAQYLDRETAKIDQAINVLAEKVTTLKEYKTTLIANVVTGKVRV